MIRVGRVAVGVVVAGLVVLGDAGTTVAAAPLESGRQAATRWVIQNTGTGNCLARRGNNAVTAACRRVASQQWDAVDVGYGGRLLRNVENGRCLQRDLTLGGCQAADDAATWFRTIGDTAATGFIINALEGRYLRNASDTALSLGGFSPTHSELWVQSHPT